MLLLMALPRLVHETKGLLFVDKPQGLSFHTETSDDGSSEPGLLPLLRSMQANGELGFDGRLYSVHRLDRVTSGLIMVAKSADAAREVGELLRQRALDKYYVALTARKPSKKMGRVVGDMARSRRGQWMLLRTKEQPAVTAFVSERLEESPLAEEQDSEEHNEEPLRRQRALRAFLLKPKTGRTHQLRVALKCVGAPILGDPMYAAAADAAGEDRCYLHSAALRLPAGCEHLSGGGEPIEVFCPPTEGAEFRSRSFGRQWERWFGAQQSGSGGEWFEGTPIASTSTLDARSAIARGTGRRKLD